MKKLWTLFFNELNRENITDHVEAFQFLEEFSKKHASDFNTESEIFDSIKHDLEDELSWA